ncbi:hypothetical protein EVAR_53069_1 [Eumeta japonica]|uniref:Uncharacterized protein n=1 Tax=Eumeta variegata TaxID=151549 RepID=A0A4C1YW56_EUMVA|nr:hypothetical protein EVAR_53069_1 [Eumeta japonica]
MRGGRGVRARTEALQVEGLNRCLSAAGRPPPPRRRPARAGAGRVSTPRVVIGIDNTLHGSHRRHPRLVADGGVANSILCLIAAPVEAARGDAAHGAVVYDVRRVSPLCCRHLRGVACLITYRYDEAASAHVSTAQFSLELHHYSNTRLCRSRQNVYIIDITKEFTLIRNRWLPKAPVSLWWMAAYLLSSFASTEIEASVRCRGERRRYERSELHLRTRATRRGRH